jgi:hypothetical protein
MALKFFISLLLVIGCWAQPAVPPVQRVFDVTAYGAKCDNSTDDSSAFTTAINSAILAGTGGIIYIPPKRCVINSPVYLSSNTVSVTVEGVGPASVITTTVAIGDLLRITGTAPQYIQNLTFTSNVAKTAGAFIGNYGNANQNSISSLTCSSGTVTLTNSVAFTSLPSAGSLLAVRSVSPAGFNGTFATSSISGSTATFALTNPDGTAKACPAGSGSGGQVFWNLSTTAAANINNYSRITNCTFDGGAGGYIGVDWEMGGAYWWINSNQWKGTFTAEAILINGLGDTDNAGGNIEQNQMNITGDAFIRVNSSGGLVIDHNSMIGNYNYGIDLNAIGGVQFSGGAGGSGGVGQIMIDSNWIVAWSSTGYAVRMNQSSGFGTVEGGIWIQNCYFDQLQLAQNREAILINALSPAVTYTISIQNNAIEAPITIFGNSASPGPSVSAVNISGNTFLMNRTTTVAGIINITATGNNIQSTLIANNYITAANKPAYVYAGLDQVVFIDDVGDSSGSGTTFTNLPAGSRAGSKIWITDGTVGSPCTGGGTGARAYREGTAWNCYAH